MTTGVVHLSAHTPSDHHIATTSYVCLDRKRLVTHGSDCATMGEYESKPFFPIPRHDDIQYRFEHAEEAQHNLQLEWHVIIPINCA
jgi:hypothetical protein